MRESRGRRWLVSGRVQGVGFRYFVRRAAGRGSCVGEVRNLPDGRVEIRVQGPDADLAELLAEVRRGPWGSSVLDVEVDEIDVPPGWSEFSIRH